MAIDGTYRITIDLGGRKTGTATIASDGNRVRVALDAPVIGNIVARGDAGPNDTFTVSGRARVLFRRIDYTINGSIEGDKLTAVCDTNLGSMTVSGERI